MAWRLVRECYRLLERPSVYEAVQRLFSIGGNDEVRRLFAEICDPGPNDRVLELGCGTGTWTPKSFARLVRTDIIDAYFPQNPPDGVEYRKVDATALTPFCSASFDLVYSIGLYHHLPDEAAVRSLKESARVLTPSGRIVVMDAVLPPLWRCLPWVVRKLDRGGWVRHQRDTEKLFAQANLVIRRAALCRWSLIGLEGCFWELVPTSSRPPMK